MVSDRTDINRVLLEMRAIKSQTQFPQSQPSQAIHAGHIAPYEMIPGESIQQMSPEIPHSSSFSQLMNQAINKVNDVQNTSKKMTHAYERGQSGTDIIDVMIASQKATVSFQAMVQVRNKLLEAYKDVMNMPV